jgi:hypothetical protein
MIGQGGSVQTGIPEHTIFNNRLTFFSDFLASNEIQHIEVPSLSPSYLTA